MSDPYPKYNPLARAYWTVPASQGAIANPTPPDPTPDEQALAEILWDGSGESIGWCEAFKHAQSIIAAGFHR